MTYTVRCMEEDDVGRVAALLGRALGTDPAYAFVFPKVATRFDALSDLFARNLRIHLPHRCTHLLVEGGDIHGTVTVRPPGGVPISLLTKIRHGLLPFTIRNGVEGTKRLLAIADLYDRIESQMAPAPHWHVHMMAVEPAQQGKGLGTTLLREVLERTDHAAPVPTVLTTHEERNVMFYRRFGFEISTLRRVRPGPAPYPVWCMHRPPPSVASSDAERGRSRSQDPSALQFLPPTPSRRDGESHRERS